MKEIDSLLITAENNSLRMNYIKAKINNMQQNSKCRLYGEKYKTINHIQSECSKLAQKEYKARHKLVVMVIHLELCKKLKFDHTNKWNMHKPESVLENEMHKFPEILRYKRIT